eukprot:866042-Rhodomonas_salina.2
MNLGPYGPRRIGPGGVPIGTGRCLPAGGRAGRALPGSGPVAINGSVVTVLGSTVAINGSVVTIHGIMITKKRQPHHHKWHLSP